MKKTQLLNWVLFALLAFTFSACENEPLEGQFVTDDGDVSADDGQFVAKINGVTFLAEATDNVYNPDSGALVISGTKQDGDAMSCSGGSVSRWLGSAAAASTSKQSASARSA